MTSTAVILAAGMGIRLRSQVADRPKGLLQLGAQPIVEESIAMLLASGVERVVLVTGHRSEAYDDLVARHPGLITTVRNDRYDRSGTMYSLYCARSEVDGDFLLLESDLIYEPRALDEVNHHRNEADTSCLLMSGLTGAGDEIYIRTDEGSRLVTMSKDRSLIGVPSGELVGITRVSASLFGHMLDYAESAFSTSLRVDYETDCLVGVVDRYPIRCRLVPDLVWSEIDDEHHLRRAATEVYPAIEASRGKVVR